MKRISRGKSKKKEGLKKFFQYSDRLLYQNLSSFRTHHSIYDSGAVSSCLHRTLCRKITCAVAGELNYRGLCRRTSRFYTNTVVGKEFEGIGYHSETTETYSMDFGFVKRVFLLKLISVSYTHLTLPTKA